MKPVALALVASCAVFSASQGSAEDVNATLKGKELYERHCALCHGDAAVGQNRDYPAGGWDGNKMRLAPALNGTGHAWHHSPSLMYRYIQHGSIDESSPMPSFGDRLGENDIRTIIAYVQSLWPDKILQHYRQRFGSEMK